MEFWDNKKITVIANPTSQNGEAKAVAEFVNSQLKLRGFDVSFHFTSCRGDAERLVFSFSSESDIVLAVGGDGLVHEIVNALMKLKKQDRSSFALIPAGTGNDYARSLKMSLKPKDALEQLMKTRQTKADLGVCNGEYFAQTLSFGLDAAIALGTIERRIKTGKTGTRVFFEEGLYQLKNHLDLIPFSCNYLDNQGEPHSFTGQTYMLATQVGKTYGGGFEICPNAEINNGLFDVCYVTPNLSFLSALGLFLLAKNGHHTQFKNIKSFQAKEMHLSISGDQKIQIDGEPLSSSCLDLTLACGAINVYKNA